MSAEEGACPARRRRRRAEEPAVDYGPAPAEVHPSIAALRGRHRAAHPDLVSVLDMASHMLMFKEWPVNCPRFMTALRAVGLDCVSQMQYVRIDHHLLTAFVERWSSQTNSFHLPIGEMTVTLQDVAMILGIQIDGPPIIGPNVVGGGRRWASWPDCCDKLIGGHPEPNTVYHDPIQPDITSEFRMGQAHAQTCLPLRWLRWTYYRDSYLDMPEHQFSMHLRAYILFAIGCFLMPDTSCSEIHLQYLPLLEDLDTFREFSLGAAVLAHLYRELHEATKPKRTNMAGCLQLLQVWVWEHIHVGRPTLHIPYPTDIDGLSVGCRWNEGFVREVTPAHIRVYRDEQDDILQSQVIWEPYGAQIRARVADICLHGDDIWLARVPMISWKRVEWHQPDRVLRQFGLPPTTEVAPVESSFVRVDGRGKADMDWVIYHQTYIAQWESRRELVVVVDSTQQVGGAAINRYMRWYRSWATLYMLKAPTVPPNTYYPRAPGDRLMREHILNTEDIFRRYFGRADDTEMQQSINEYEGLCRDLHTNMYISDSRHGDTSIPGTSASVQSDGLALDIGPSSPPVVGLSTYTFTQPSQYSYQGSMWPQMHPWQQPVPPTYGPPSFHMTPPYGLYHGYSQQPSEQAEPEDQQLEHQLRDRPRRPPAHYTPGSDAIPHRRHHRR